MQISTRYVLRVLECASARARRAQQRDRISECAEDPAVVRLVREAMHVERQKDLVDEFSLAEELHAQGVGTSSRCMEIAQSLLRAFEIERSRPLLFQSHVSRVISVQHPKPKPKRILKKRGRKPKKGTKIEERKVLRTTRPRVVIKQTAKRKHGRRKK